MQFVALDWRQETLNSLYVVAADEDVDVLADLTLLVQDAVAKCPVELEKLFTSVADGRRFAV